MKKLVDILLKERKQESKSEEEEETQTESTKSKLKLKPNLKKLITKAKSKLKWKQEEFSIQTYLDVIKLNYFQNQSLKNSKWSCVKKLFEEVGKKVEI